MSTTATVVNPNRALWEKGDFTAIAATMRESGEALAKSLGIKPSMKVMDLGCGDGTTALPMAHLGANVTGIDISRNLLAAAEKRAQEARLRNLTIQEGDACDLKGVPDHTFDLSFSCFGAMFAPKPFDVAREMVRVTKPGGRVVMGNWIPGDPTFVSQLLRISSAFTPPPPEGFISPMLWGVESNIQERFGQAGVAREKITLMKDTFYFISPEMSAARFIDVFRRFYGPTMNAFEAAEKNGKAEELYAQLVDLAKSKNQAKGAAISIPATFLRVTVSV